MYIHTYNIVRQTKVSTRRRLDLTGPDFISYILCNLIQDQILILTKPK